MARAPTAASTAAANQGEKKKKGGKQAPTDPQSKAQKKKAAKRAKKAAQASWCWYCDREFQDDKVLLSHQKSKHFRCPHCPRRLNTAGGLAVHIDQVHKVPTDRIENTLPGRDSFDVEIYGMEGIPKDDLAEWRRKRDAELGLTPNASKRPKVYKGVISIEDLAKQLAMHRNLMRQSAAGGVPRPPGMPGLPMPPPGMALPGGIPMPPPGMFPLPPGSVFPPALIALSYADMLPCSLLHRMMPIPPAGFGSPLPGAPAPGIPGVPPPSLLQPQRPPQPAAAPSAPAYTAPSSRVELKTGQIMVYGDNEVSVE
ncbi:hypothetical protein BT93_L5594, partial [Corymbia citriodora subsp. variegata]